MDYLNLASFAIAGTGGLILGTVFGQKLTANGTSVMKAIESRLATIESMFSGDMAQTADGKAHAAAVEMYAGVTEKLASAIEKHAAAIDDHGAAMVVAAVETHAATNPGVNPSAVKNA